jgi:hypothetical protein
MAPSSFTGQRQGSLVVRTSRPRGDISSDLHYFKGGGTPHLAGNECDMGAPRHATTLILRYQGPGQARGPRVAAAGHTISSCRPPGSGKTIFRAVSTIMPRSATRSRETTRSTPLRAFWPRQGSKPHAVPSPHHSISDAPHRGGHIPRPARSVSPTTSLFSTSSRVPPPRPRRPASAPGRW